MESVYFRSSYWDDNFIDGLSIEANHLYLYIITSRQIQPSGIFKINWNECILKSKLKTKTKVLKVLNKDLKNKIFFYGEWIFIKSFLRKSFKLPTSELSKNIKKSIEKQFVNERPPINIIACFHELYSYLDIPYPYPLDTLSQYIETEVLDLGFSSETKTEKETQEGDSKREDQKSVDNSVDNSQPIEEEKAFKFILKRITHENKHGLETLRKLSTGTGYKYQGETLLVAFDKSIFEDINKNYQYLMEKYKFKSVDRENIIAK
jgi:hypothetical protein